MKRLLTIPFMLIYLLTFIGPTIKMHYCDGELVDFKLITQRAVDVGCCDLPVDDSCGILAIDNDCCHDVLVELQLDENAYQVVLQPLELLQHTIVPSQLSYNYVVTAIYSADARTYHGLAPPFDGLWQQRPLYDLYSSRKLDC